MHGNGDKTLTDSLIFISLPVFASPFQGHPKVDPLKGVFYFLNPDYFGDMDKYLKQKPLRIFLCYSHKDFKAVHALWSRLTKDGIEVWLDKENLQPGENWANEIRREILKSDIVIVCLSKKFNNKIGFRHQELRIALEKAKLFSDNETFIVPIRLEKCDMPKSIRHLHRLDLFTRNGYKKLLFALRN